MATNKKARTSAVNIDGLLGQSERRRRAFEHRSDVLEAAALIRELRKHAGVSQEELAKRIGTHQSHISELERGNGPQGPTFAMLKRIARACGDPLVVLTKKEWLLLRRKAEMTRNRASLLQKTGREVEQSMYDRYAQLREKHPVQNLGRSSIISVLEATPSKMTYGEIRKLMNEPRATPDPVARISPVDRDDLIRRTELH